MSDERDESANEWQPARLVLFHKYEPGATDYRTDSEISAIEWRVVRVRPAIPSQWPQGVRDYRAEGCDAVRFYEIHPADIGCLAIVCEHEILTD
jgi:hypothetical protein